MSGTWSKDMYVEPHTFGNTKACEILADMMNNNIVSAYEKHRTLAFINKASRMYNGAFQIPDKNIRNSIFELINKDVMNKINMMSYSPKYISYLKNVMIYYYRKFLEK